MLKVTFDGNRKDGYSICILIPSDLTKDQGGSNLIVDEADNLVDCLPRIRQTILKVEEFDLFEKEFVIVHEDSAFEPGPHPESAKHFESLDAEIQGFDKEPGDLVGKPFDSSTLPQSPTDEE